MDDQRLLQHITTNPNVMTGKPVIKGTRLTVEFILNQLAHGMSFGDIKDEYDGVTDNDIRACLLFAETNYQS